MIDLTREHACLTRAAYPLAARCRWANAAVLKRIQNGLVWSDVDCLAAFRELDFKSTIARMKRIVRACKPFNVRLRQAALACLPFDSSDERFGPAAIDRIRSCPI